ADTCAACSASRRATRLAKERNLASAASSLVDATDNTSVPPTRNMATRNQIKIFQKSRLMEQYWEGMLCAPIVVRRDSPRCGRCEFAQRPQVAGQVFF